MGPPLPRASAGPGGSGLGSLEVLENFLWTLEEIWGSETQRDSQRRSHTQTSLNLSSSSRSNSVFLLRLWASPPHPGVFSCFYFCFRCLSGETAPVWEDFPPLSFRRVVESHVSVISLFEGISHPAWTLGSRKWETIRKLKSCKTRSLQQSLIRSLVSLCTFSTLWINFPLCFCSARSHWSIKKSPFQPVKTTENGHLALMRILLANMKSKFLI